MAVKRKRQTTNNYLGKRCKTTLEKFDGGNKNTVYIIKITTPLYHKPIVKLGFTIRDPAIRIRELANEYSCKNIEIIKLYHVDGIWIELDFHSMFRDLQLRNIKTGTEFYPYSGKMISIMTKYMENHVMNQCKINKLEKTCKQLAVNQSILFISFVVTAIVYYM